MKKLNLHYERMLFDSFSGKKGYVLDNHSYLIVTDAKVIVDSINENSATNLPIFIDNQHLHLVVAKTEGSAEYVFYVYDDNLEKAKNTIQNFVSSFHIGGAETIEDVIVINALTFVGGKNNEC